MGLFPSILHHSKDIGRGIPSSSGEVATPKGDFHTLWPRELDKDPRLIVLQPMRQDPRLIMLQPMRQGWYDTLSGSLGPDPVLAPGENWGGREIFQEQVHGCEPDFKYSHLTSFRNPTDLLKLIKTESNVWYLCTKFPWITKCITKLKARKPRKAEEEDERGALFNHISLVSSSPNAKDKLLPHFTHDPSAIQVPNQSIHISNYLDRDRL